MSSHISPVIACDQALLEVEFMRDSDIELLAVADLLKARQMRSVAQIGE